MVDIPEFDRQVMEDLRQGRAEQAITRTRDMVRLAHSASDDETALMLYSILRGIYSFTGDSERAQEVRRERAAKYAARAPAPGKGRTSP